MDETLYQALKARQTITFTYQRSTMNIEPYCYAKTNACDDVLIGYEPTAMQWMMFLTSEMSQAQLTGQTFQPRSDYTKSNFPIESVYSELSY